MDRDGFISNGELFLVLKMMVGNNLKDQQLQQIVDKSAPSHSSHITPRCPSSTVCIRQSCADELL